RVMLSDSYKYSHPKQYPSNTVSLFDYAEARSGKQYDKTVFFGLQYILKQYFTTPITMEEVEEANEYAQAHGIDFEYDGWKYIATELQGRIPVTVRAIPEGKVIPVKNALFTVESKDPKVFWVASWMETILMKVWYTSNIATRSYYVREMLSEYIKKTT
ncbi:MAG: nicotinamide phosphoribosyltransferase domain-containing protein, partial [Candidatus Cloacimonadota bacterium]|nr:nicotinamide phosphoribosyltransferase domain-containing protein [Candidatus Cloacimonadota bacterium]